MTLKFEIEQERTFNPYDLGITYFIQKESKDELDKLRKIFFKTAKESFSKETLAVMVARTPIYVETESEARTYIERYHPGWIIDEVSCNPVTSQWTSLIKEDPNYKPFSIAYPYETTDKDGKYHPGFYMAKTIRSGTKMIDDEAIYNHDFLFWMEISRPKNEEWYDLLKSMNVDLRDWEREIIPPDLWTVEQTAKIAKYTYEGSKTIALNVRYAKESDFE